MMQPMGGPPQFGPPVEMDGQQWMGPVAEQMVPLNCPPGIQFYLSISDISVYPFTNQSIYQCIHSITHSYISPAIH